MKELIEYVLAVLIIASFIPIFDVIVMDITTTKPPIIESSTLLYISSGVRDVLLNVFSQGNFTPTIVDITEMISSKLNLSNDMGFNVRIVSSGIIKVTVNESNVYVLTSSPGRLSICIVYSDLTYTYNSTNTPVSSLFNGTLIYKFNIPRSDVIAVSAILETGVARFIDYWLSPNIYRVYTINIDNTIVIAVPDSVPQPEYYTLSSNNVVDASLIYYTNGRYYNYTMTSGKFIVELTFEQTYYGYEGDGYYKHYLSKYVASYYRQISIDGKLFYLHKLQDYVRKDTHYIEYIYDSSENYLEIYHDEVRSTQSYFYDIKHPIYNLVFIFLRDSAGKIYYAVIYPHSLVIGESVPSNWITYVSEYNVRIGMINYDIVITVWRRYQA